MKNKIKEKLNNIIDVIVYKEQINLLKKKVKELEEERKPLIDLKNKYLSNLRVNNLELGRLKKQLDYLRSNEYLNQVKWERNFNEELVKDLQERIDKGIKYTKTLLKFARLEKDFEKEKILLNFLEILGDKENER